MTHWNLRLVLAALLLVLCGGCAGYSYIEGHIELPDRSRPVISTDTVCGYGAGGRFTKSGAPDLRYDCRKY